MGNAESCGPFKEGPVSKLSQYGVTTVSTMLQKYWDLDMEFGLQESAVSELLEASGISCQGDDGDIVPALMKSFPNETAMNAIDFIVAFAILSKGGASTKAGIAYDAINFNKGEDVTFDELIILLLCIGRGLACISGVQTEYDPKTMGESTIQELERGTVKMLQSDFDLGPDANLAAETVSKEKYLAWFETKFSNPATHTVEGTLDVCYGKKPRAKLSFDVDAFFERAAKVRDEHPGNRCVKYLTRELFDSFSADEQETLYRCARTGVENADSGLGCYAMTPSDYETFSGFFDPLIRDYHKASADAVHTSSWDASSVGDNGVLDVSKLGLDELSMRVRVGRNLASFNLPGKMDKAERIRFEQTMLAAFEKLKAMPEYGGNVYSLSPDHGEGVENPNLISDEKYQELVDAHVMFKDMDADPYLKSAGISSDWPYGRGCWQSDDKQCIIWFGEEDQLRIMCMKKGTRLDEVFSRLKGMLDTVESIEGIAFAKNDKYGYVTSCPSNLGTGMRASVHIKVPNLTSDGTDKRAKEVARPLGLSVRGTGGEHTPIGADGTIDITPSARLFIEERQIIEALYKGIELLMQEEQAAGASEGKEECKDEEKSSTLSFDVDAFFERAAKVRDEHPGNRCVKEMYREDAKTIYFLKY